MKEKLEDKELLLLIRANNYEAFEHIYKRYAAKLYGFSLRILKNEAESEEIVQDTFLKVWEKRYEINENLHFNTYLVTIAKHKIYNFFRRKVVECKYEDSLTNDIALSDTEADSHLEDLKGLIFSKVAKLPLRQKEIMTLKLEGINNDEIANMLQISKKTVENHLNRAYGQLRIELGDRKNLLPLLIFLFPNIF